MATQAIIQVIESYQFSCHFGVPPKMPHDIKLYSNDCEVIGKYMHAWFDAQLDQKILDGLYQ